MSQTETTTEITCPACGANLGPAVPTGEYQCPYCKHVSHDTTFRPHYGAREGILAMMAKEAAEQQNENALREARRAPIEPPAPPLVANDTGRRVGAVLCLCVAAGALVLGLGLLILGLSIDVVALSAAAASTMLVGLVLAGVALALFRRPLPPKN